MTIDQQLEQIIKERNEFESKAIAALHENEQLKARNNSLEHINQGLVDAINQSDDDGKHPDIVWLTRTELKGYSDVHQAGGINAVKTDAIDILGNIMEREFGGHIGSFVRLYVDKLRGANDKPS